jgi:hypothetical protein
MPLMPNAQGSTERTTGITGGRLNPYVIEYSGAQEFTIYHTVKGDTPCKA